MLSNIAPRHRAEDRVGHRVQGDVGIGMSIEAGFTCDGAPAQYEWPPILEAVDIEALTNPHVCHDPDSTIARIMSRSASVVIFGFG